MRLGDILPVFAGKKKISSDENDEYRNIHEKNEPSSAYTEERLYPALGENYSMPGVIRILRFAVSVILLVLCAVIDLSNTVNVIIKIAAALIIGYDIVIFAVKDILKRMLLRENLFVAVAAILSFCIGRGTEAVIALILLQTAYAARDYALYRSRNTICNSIESEATVLRGRDTGNTAEKAAYSIGDTVSIEAGMYVSIDCIIIDGSGMVDLKAITGDRSPVLLSKGKFLPAGSICLEGKFTAKVSETEENTLDKNISSILESGYGKMTETERIWKERTKYIPLFSLFVSVVMLIVLPLVFDLSLTEVLRRVITIIAIASPCGILLAIPITYFSGMATARKLGIVFREAGAIEKSALIKSVVFNKVGTLTGNEYSVIDIKTDKMDSDTFLKVAAYAESNSKSAVAKAIVSAFGGEITKELVQNFTEYPEKGVSVTVDGISIILGNSAFICENGVPIPNKDNEYNTIHMSVNGIYAGRINLRETVTPDSSDTLKELSDVGVERIAMVSEDGRERDGRVASELGINEYYAECSTEEKAKQIESMKDRIDSRCNLTFVGSYDCPKQLFDTADIGIAINAVSSSSALPQSDVMIMANTIKSLPEIIREGKNANRTVLLGVLISCLIKLIIMALAAFGIAPLWFGLLIDICASLVVIVGGVGAEPIFSKISFKK